MTGWWVSSSSPTISTTRHVRMAKAIKTSLLDYGEKWTKGVRKAGSATMHAADLVCYYYYLLPGGMAT